MASSSSSAEESDDYDFPEAWSQRIENADQERIFRRIARDQATEAREIATVSRRSALRWIVYAIVFGALCYGLWLRHEALIEDFHELRALLAPSPLIVHPLRTQALRDPLDHRPPSDHVLGAQVRAILDSLRYWLRKEPARACMCAHHVVTDAFPYRLCIVPAAQEDSIIVMWNMRVTGRVIDAEAQVEAEEHSPFCDSPKTVSRSSIAYMTWEHYNETTTFRVNAFYGAAARCLQMAEEEMDASYECA